ncbi:glycosyltransferase [Promicromonospora sp. CA-289599]|uniref:glycosyltransferase n=1 Tax=Promicromonospora sp. CA-289599 TaxID=3240014 RepID=UPI003D8CF04F
MAHVLLIAPACDGADVGESWLAHQWAHLLSQRFQVTLLSTYKKGHVPPSRQLPAVRVVEWAEPPLVHRAERLNSLLQPAYVPFYARARRYVRGRLAAGDRFDVAHQVTPVAMRYPSPVAGLGIPLVVGPVGGSLESPPAFAHEEGATPWYQRLRRLDRLRLRRDPLLRATYEDADCVVGIAPYVRELLGDLRLRRFEELSDVAVHTVPPPEDRSGRSGPVRLLHVGRMVRTKGARDVIRAMALLRDLPVVLDVVGDGADRAACADLVRDLGLGDRVLIHGGPGANVSDACAVRVPAESPEQLARDVATAVRRLVAEPDLRLRMGAAAREHVVANHLWDRRIERMTDLYEQIAVPRTTGAGQVPG